MSLVGGRKEEEEVEKQSPVITACGAIHVRLVSKAEGSKSPLHVLTRPFVVVVIALDDTRQLKTTQRLHATLQLDGV